MAARNETQSTSMPEEDLEPIAVVGFAARLPQDGESPEGFWNMMYEGRNASTEMPKDRVNMDAFYHENGERPDTCNVRNANFLNGDMAAFDAHFFSIQPVEAESMDPQQRILLETCYQALENAGVKLDQIAGSNTSVHVAASNRDYEVLLYRDSEQTPKYMGTGIGSSLLSNRLSWFFNLRGPSISLDTACSGSLTALHLACQTLHSGESSLALVGGVSLILVPDASMTQLSTLGFLSPDGISYSFDHRANGYAKGEGATVVVLKRLSEAIMNNDTIRAIVRATSVNQDGRTPGITQPSKSAQTANIVKAYSCAGLNLDETGYFEAHGTGTAMGDPIEAEAIFDAFKRSAENPLHIGSLKANIGHLEANAGLAALVKSIHILERGIIPPNACFESINPRIPAGEWGLKFLHAPIPFPTTASGLRRISINNFGYGGSNAHAIVDDAPHFLRSRGLTARHCTIEYPIVVDKTTGAKLNGNIDQNGMNGHSGSDNTDANGHGIDYDPKRPPYVLLWSAADESGIGRMLDKYELYFKKIAKVEGSKALEYLQSLSYTLCHRRSDLSWKSYSIVQSFEQLQEGLSGKRMPIYRSSGAPTISFVFTGQGAQWFAMAQGLSSHSVFADSIQRSEMHLKAIGCRWSLKEELAKGANSSRVDDPELSQPLCTALQIALIDLLESWNIRPVAVVGHSSGEIAAAYCAKAISQDSAIKVAFYRGQVTVKLQSKNTVHGGMISIGLSAAEAEAYITETCRRTGTKISIGCVNSPSNVTVTGDAKGIDDLNQVMEARGIFARKLQVNVAYHSHHMTSVAPDYMDMLGDTLMKVYSKSIHNEPLMFSSVSGTTTSAGALSSKYWVDNLTSQVKFSQATSQMISFLNSRRKIENGNTSGQDIICEIGPHSALQRPIKDIIGAMSGVRNFSYATCLSQNTKPLLALAHFAGDLRSRGVRVDLLKVSSCCSITSPQLLTDVPTYPFNHSRTYWTESRFSRNRRFREFGRHELLGAREQDWNPLMPRWRNIIRIQDEHPWIRDHKFGQTGLYPASAMLTMAIEGSRQVLGKQDLIDGYLLENISFPNGFVVPPEEGTMEAQVHFHPVLDIVTGTHVKYDFKIFGLVNDQWLECCVGTISAQKFVSGGTVHKRSIENVQNEDLVQLATSRKHGAWESIGPDHFYERLTTMQYALGPAFQSLSSIEFNDLGQAKTKLALGKWASKYDCTGISAHVVHPVDLDAIFQSTIAAESQGGLADIPVLIPTSIRSLWISHSMFNRADDEILNIYVSRTAKGFRDSDFGGVAVDSLGHVCSLLDGFRQTALSGEIQVPQHLSSKRLNYSIEWKPDIQLLGAHTIRQLCNISINHMIPAEEFVDRQELVSYFYMKVVIDHASDFAVNKMPDHLEKYVRWARNHFNTDTMQKIRKSQRESEALFGNIEQRERYLDEFSKEGPEAKLIVETGRKIIPILRGETDALALLFSANLVADYYTSASCTLNLARLRTYLDLLGHKNPSLNILEIGAGTGSATRAVLRTLAEYSESFDTQEKDIPKYKQYTFTDISPAFLGEAESNFCHYPNMKYAVLDIEKDPLSQGFEAQQYDLVVCGAVLHATTNIRNTLINVRKLLRPGGKLVLIEPTSLTAVRTSFVFGLLPGWWLSSEDFRKWGPCLSDNQWHDLLLETGFNGVEVGMPDQPDPSRRMYSVLISTASEKNQIRIDDENNVAILISDKSEIQSEVAQLIIETIQSSVSVVTVSQMCQFNWQGKRCISLVELSSSFFFDIAAAPWKGFKHLTTSAASVLWVVRKCNLEPESLALSLVSGMTRSLQSEYTGIQFRQLAIEMTSTQSQICTSVVQLLRNTASTAPEPFEIEYEEKEGQLNIPRLFPVPILNHKVERSILQISPKMEEFGLNNRRLDLTISNIGLLDTLCFRDDSSDGSTLRETDLEIEVYATGMNFKDIMLAMGKLAGSTLGFEFAGVVSRVGRDVPFKPGDRVCGCTLSGAYKKFVRADASAVISIPDNVTYDYAAAVPMVYATAYYSLITLANLQEGESVLIHSAAGGVGQAAINIAKRLNANIFVTVGSDDKRLLIKELYGIPDSHIFDSHSTEFAQAIRTIVKDGADVILNSLSGTGLIASWECIAPLGRFVELGKVDIEYSRRGLPMGPFERNVSFRSVSLDVVMEKSPATMRRVMNGVSSFLSDHKNPVKAPYPLNKFSIGRIEEAFRYMAAGKHSGKVIVEMQKGDKVPVLPSRKASYYFHKNATYVIAGGFGGLGRTIIKWMAKRNARNFLILSRSGADNNPAAKVLIDQMLQDGVKIMAPRCDITDKMAVTAVFDEYRKLLPPIRGCIQASMVLKDSILEYTTTDMLHAVLGPKTHGTLNLEANIPPDLDFFVLLSSVAGVTGSRGQTNYAMANVFQDAFARQRAAQGRHCISLNLGAILSVGFAAERNLAAALRRDGFEGVTRAEFLSLLDYVCDPACPAAQDPARCQIVSGLAGAETISHEQFSNVYWAQKPMFKPLQQLSALSGDHVDNTRAKEQQAAAHPGLLFGQAENRVSAVDIVSAALVERFAKLMAVPTTEVDTRKPMGSFGIDSLVSLELKYWLGKELGADLTVLDIMNAAGLEDLASTVTEKSTIRMQNGKVGVGAAKESATKPSQIGKLGRGAQILE